jgi:hypothetical protein
MRLLTSRWLPILLAGALSLCAGLAFVPTFGLAALALPLAIEAMAAVLVGAATTRRLGLAVSIVVGVVLAWPVSTAALAVSHLVRSTPPEISPLSVLEGLRDGAYEILSAVAPTPPTASALAVPLLLTWIVGFTTSALVVRTRALAGLLVPALVGAFVGFLFAPIDRPLTTAALAGAFVAVGGLLLVVRTSVPPEAVTMSAGRLGDEALRPLIRAMLRRIAVGIPVIAGVALLSVVLVGLLPTTSTPFGLRQYVEPPADRRSSISPLTLAQTYRTVRSNDLLFTVRSDQVPQQWMLAPLEEFDGRSWAAGGSYAAAAEELPPPPPGRSRRDTLSQAITIDRLEGFFVPVSGWPTQVVTDPYQAIDVDPASGTVALRRGELRPGQGFRETSQVAQPPPSALASLDAPNAGGPTATLPSSTSPETVTAFETLARQVVARGRSPFTRGVLIEQYLQREFVIDTEKPGGQSIQQLRVFLFQKRGTPEQFAAAFVVLARSVGIPSRVVVGFRDGERRDDGTIEVRGRHVAVWPEVELAEVGWVPFSPLPDPTRPPLDTPPSDELAGGGDDDGAAADNTTDEPSDQSATAPSTTGPSGTSPDSQASTPSITSPSTSSPANPAADALDAAKRQAFEEAQRSPEVTEFRPLDEPSTSASPLWLLAVSGVILVAMVALWRLAVPWRKRRRRQRRRRAADPRRRITGAWDEVLDRVEELTRTDTRTLSTERAATLTVESFGPDVGGRVAVLGGLADRALYAADDLSPAEADRAWDQEAEIVSRLLDSLPNAERWQARLDRRTLKLRRLTAEVSRSGTDGG